MSVTLPVKAIGPSDNQNHTLPSRRRLLTHLRQRDAEGCPGMVQTLAAPPELT